MGVLKDIESMMTKEEIAQNDREYVVETAALREAMTESQESLAQSLAQMINIIMNEEKISQNELSRRLQVSSRTMTQLVNGRGNPTISTIAKMASMSKKRAKLVWE